MVTLTILLIIMTFILWIISLIVDDIKITVLTSVFAFLALFSSFFIDKEHETKMNLDLPEEYQEISKCSCKHDTLLGYYKDGKLVIEFKPK